MGNGSGVSRGDRNRNARLGRLRVRVPVTNAIAGIDLADKKQMVVVTDHDSKVIARVFRCRAWDLGVALNWPPGAQRPCPAGQTGVVGGAGTDRDQPLDHGQLPGAIEGACVSGEPPRHPRTSCAQPRGL